jgi:hypothetical protein
MARSPRIGRTIIVDKAEVQFVEEIAEAHEVTVKQAEQRGIEPVSTVVLTLFGVFSAVGAVEHVLEQRRGGQVIDLRPQGGPAFYRTPKLEHGIVLIIAADGKVTVRIKEPDAMFGKVIATLPRLLTPGGSAREAAQTAARRLGADVETGCVEPLDGSE